MKLVRLSAFVGIKQEATQGTAVDPDPTTDYIEVDIDSLEIKPVGDKLARLIASTTLDKRPDVIGQRYKTISFEVEFKGSGTRGDATIAGYAGIHAAWQACGMVATVAATNSIALVSVTAGGSGYTSPPVIGFTGGLGSGATALAVIDAGAVVAIFVTNPGSGFTSDPAVTFTGGGGTGAAATVTRGGSILYGPTSGAAVNFFGPGKSVTIKAYRHGLKHTVKGALGTWSFTIDTGKYIKVKFDFTGEYQAIVDETNPSPTIVTINPPILESAKVGLLGYGGPVFSSIGWDIANTISPRVDGKAVNSIKGFVIGDRDPKGSIQMEAETVATFDPWAKWLASTEGTTALQFGSVSGNILTVVSPKGQITDVPYAKRGVFLDMALPLKFNKGTGDDSIVIVVV